MKKIYLIALISMISNVQAQIGINNSSPNASAILDLSATNKGLVLPRLTSTQRDAADGILSPVGGIVIYDSTLNCILISLENGKWKNACTGAEITTNSGTTSSTGKVGIGNITLLDKNSILEIVSSSKGVLLPKAAADLAPVTGMLYFNTTDNSVRLFDGTNWVILSRIDLSTNGTAHVSAYSCATGSNGTMIKGVSASGITQTITATVTTIGTYDIAATANGVTFYGTGTFTSLGNQTIVLTALGTPINQGSSTFTLNTDPNCSFDRITIDSSTNGTGVVTSYTCSIGSSGGDLHVGIPIAPEHNITQTIQATVTSIGTYAISAISNGVTFSASGTFTATGNQNIVLTASGTALTTGTSTFALTTTPNCTFSRTAVHPSSNGTAIVSSYTCTTASTGTLTEGVAVSGVTQTITANVTSIGSYAISISVNGITFAGSGNFTTTGNNNIILTASGTPISGGSTPFTLNTTPNCNFTRDIISLTTNGTGVVSSYSCTTSAAGLLKKGVAVAGTGVTQTLTAVVTGLGNYAISTSANGVTFTGSGNFTVLGSQTIVLTATSGSPIAIGSHTFTLNTSNSCGFDRTTIEPSSNGTAIVTSYNCSPAGSPATGSLLTGVTLLPAHNVTHTISAVVTAVGTYEITTSANGITFTASGNFTSTGTQNIVLTGSGTPLAVGTYNYVLNTTPNCNFNKTTNSATSNGSSVITAHDCSTAAAGELIIGTAITPNTVTQTITVNVTTLGSYNFTATSPSEPGVTFTASGSFTSPTGLKTVVLSAVGTPTNVGNHSYSLNTTPNCSFIRSSGAIPGSISLAVNSNTYMASVYDTDYLPYSPPTAVASLNSLAADGVNETTTVNIQGSIPTTGKTINIVVATTASVTLPAYVSPIISIPAEYTEDNISRDIKLSWDAQILSSTSRFITAKIVAIGGTLNLKKLDINAGNGNNNLGILAGTLSYIRNNANELGSLHLRIMPGIPDKMFGIADNTGSTTSHLLLYLPIETETGETWLNNNLGAYYAKIGHASFNPNQQATSYSDHLAYGSLFQWGRKADGHELINYSSGTSGVPVTNTTTSTQSDIPTHASFIRSYSDWRVTPNDDLWAFESSTNNPCPVGFKVPGETALQNLTSYSNYVQGSEEFIHIAKLTKPGVKYYTGTGNVVNAGTGNFGYYSSSTVSGSSVKIFNLYNGSIRDRASANSVRCIKN